MIILNPQEQNYDIYNYIIIEIRKYCNITLLLNMHIIWIIGFSICHIAKTLIIKLFNKDKPAITDLIKQLLFKHNVTYLKIKMTTFSEEKPLEKGLLESVCLPKKTRKKQFSLNCIWLWWKDRCINRVELNLQKNPILLFISNSKNWGSVV